MDITERQKTQRHLAKAQEIARIGSWEWDPTTDQTWSPTSSTRCSPRQSWRFSRERWSGSCIRTKSRPGTQHL